MLSQAKFFERKKFRRRFQRTKTEVGGANGQTQDTQPLDPAPASPPPQLPSHVQFPARDARGSRHNQPSVMHSPPISAYGATDFWDEDDGNSSDTDLTEQNHLKTTTHSPSIKREAAVILWWALGSSAFLIIIITLPTIKMAQMTSVHQSIFFIMKMVPYWQTTHRSASG